MKRTDTCRIGIVAVFFFCLSSIALQAQMNVTTYHNDNARTGQNTQETILTSANVNSAQFGKLFSVSVDGWVYAQPLYLSNVNIGGGTHNVLYVATEHDSLYAIDADKGTIYWHISLIPSGGTTVSSSGDLGCTDLIPEVGITGTPVIDSTAGTLYVVAKSKFGGSLVQYLHAIDVVTSAEKFGGPTFIQATVPGTASDGNGTTVSFNPHFENQRAALLLVNGHVVIGWSSHCDGSPWHGWIMSYSASTLAQEAVFNTSPNGSANGVWMSGGGLAADSNGNIFFPTGNGTWNGTTDYGDSLVKLGSPGGGSFPVLDYFTPYNQNTLSGGDTDVASGGLVLLPQLPSGQQLLAQMGKEGRIYLVNRNKMGKYCVNQTPPCNGNDPNIVQEIPGATVGLWGTPAYWNGSVYWGGGSDSGGTDTVKAFSFNANNSGLISTSPTSQSAKEFSFSTPSPSISANGTANGILWGMDNSAYAASCVSGSNCQVLYAYDATNLANMLYNSTQAANNRDVPGGAVKFTTPTIANGKVYVGSQFAVSAYGIFSATPTAATPIFSPAPGSYTSSLNVNLSDSTSGAAIHCTTDGSTPTSSSPLCNTVAITSTTTLKAIAIASGYNPSNLAGGTYTVDPGAIAINYGSGFTSTGLTFNGTAKLNGSRLRLTDGGSNEAGSAFISTPINVQNFSMDFGFQLSNANSDGLTLTIQGVGATALGPAGGGLGYGPDTPGKTPGIAKSVAIKFDIYSNDGEGTDSTGLYTDGASPTVPALDMTSSGVVLLSDDIFNVHMTNDGTTLAMTITDATNSAKTFAASWPINIPSTVGSNTAYLGFTAGTGGLSAIQDILDWTYVTTIHPTAATPTFNPSPGVYSSPQTVTLSDTNTGAVIHCTTNGTTPTASSPVCTTLSVSTTTTILAIAVASGFNNSAVASGTYTINTSGYPSVSYGSGFSSIGLALNGSAKLSGPRLRITDGGTNEASSGYYTTPVNIQSFTTDFSFQLTNPNADGFAFVIQNAGTSALSVGGGGLGYGPDTPGGTPGIPTSLAIKFDLYSNAGEGSNCTGLYLDGASPTVPAISLGGSVNLHSGDVFNVHIIYDGTTLILTITDATTPTDTLTTSWKVNIPGTVGANTAYVGFSGGTGGLTSIQDILSWTYVTTPQPSVSYGSGFSSTGLALNGSAKLSGTRLRITDGGTNEASSAFYTTPLNIQSFTTDFSFQLTNPNADGFAFVIQNAGTSALSVGGGGLGYGPDTPGGTPGIPTSLAIKFDLYSNAGEGSNCTGLYLDGASPTVPAISLGGSVNLHNGDVFNVQIAYDGTTLTLTITDATTPADTFATSWKVNIPGTVGANTAYVGFSGGTGGLTAIQDILSWTFASGAA